MGDQSAIEWTDATWNPLVGCTRVSEGCRHCYAERHAIRISGPGQKYAGVVRSTAHGPQWTGVVRLVEKDLDLPLRWTRPRRIFVNSMSDLFHEKVEDAWIGAIVTRMVIARQHTYQILTKRPERMLQYFTRPDRFGPPPIPRRSEPSPEWPPKIPWPPAHVWPGVSVEDQATADARIPLLLQTPAALRWVSYEPALGPVDFSPYLSKIAGCWMCPQCGYRTNRDGEPCPNDLSMLVQDRAIDWLVVGGESGPGARPFDLAWARRAIAQGRAAGVPVFVKQVGARPFDSAPAGFLRTDVRDRKGGDPAEWSEDLRVREFPR